ncbi:MAG TPA: uroporphyrinogen decarboxylase family protein, partial [Clostridia bacterium]|nr:uroporphyrinogen decarboxylase family protein [Clostridia bacterium]
ALADYKIALIDRYHRAARLDVIWYGDDWGTQSSLFLPPPVWRSLIRPETQRIYQCMQERGILINQHSCGKVDALLPDMIEMGASLWNPCQPCNDLAGLKRLYGDSLCFVGGIDSQFVLGRPGVTPEEVTLEVKRRICEMGQGGGYIAAPSHSVPYDPALLEAMNRAIAQYGAYETNTGRLKP